MTVLSDRLGSLLKSKGITQISVADALNILPSTFNRYCKDAIDPSLPTFLFIILHLNLSPEEVYWLLTGKNQGKEN